MKALSKNATTLAGLIAPLASLGCTAGFVTSDGGFVSSGQVQFINASNSSTTYSVDIIDGGVFSFDPSVAQTSTNGPLIPAGQYYVLYTPFQDASSGIYQSYDTLTVSYSNSKTCSDHYTGNTIPCDLIGLILCPTFGPVPGGGTCSTATSAEAGIAGLVDITLYRTKADCPSPLSICSELCIDTRSDPNNCGSCGFQCVANTPCQNGVCQCPSGPTTQSCEYCSTGTETRKCDRDGEWSAWSACAGATSAQSDSNNCGACGAKCPSNSTCVAGVCQCTPNDGLRMCNTAFNTTCQEGAYANCSCINVANANYCGSCTPNECPQAGHPCGTCGSSQITSYGDTCTCQ